MAHLLNVYEDKSSRHYVFWYSEKPGSREAVLSKESSYEKYEIERGYHLMYIGKSRKFSKELSFGLVPCYLYWEKIKEKKKSVGF